MKNCKKYILGLIVVLSIGQSLNGQSVNRFNNKSQEALSKKEAALISRDLKLKKEQANNLEKVEVEFLKKRVDIDPGISSAERVLAIKELDKWHEEQLKSILTKEQYQQYLILIEKKKQEFLQKQAEMKKKHQEKKKD